MALAKKIFMEMGRKSLQRKLQRKEKREESILVAKKGNKKIVGRKGSKLSQRRVKAILKEMKMELAEKLAEMNRDKELQRKWEAKLEKWRSENRLAFENNVFTQLWVDHILDLLQALDEGDFVKASFLYSVFT